MSERTRQFAAFCNKLGIEAMTIGQRARLYPALTNEELQIAQDTVSILK